MVATIVWRRNTNFIFSTNKSNKLMSTNTMSMKEVVKIAMAQVAMQLQGKDVAIPYIQGIPGIGKTQVSLAEATRRKINMLHVHFGLTPIEEISGIPLPKDVMFNEERIKGTDWTIPEILSKSYELTKNEETGKYDNPVLIFIDDVHLCSPAHMALMFEMFTEKTLRGYPFPKKSAFILAGNSSSKAGAKTMFSAIVNRCSVYPVEADFDYWKMNFALRAGVNKKILGFLSNERYQQKYFTGEELVNSPWPSPRAWTRLGNLLNEMEGAKINPSVNEISYYSAAHVGGEAASDFSSFYNFYSKTEIDAVFDRTKKIAIPDDNSGRYIYGISAVNEYSGRIIKSDKDKKKVSDTIEIFSDIIIEISKVTSEIGFAMMKELIMIENSLKKDMQYALIKQSMRKKDAAIENKITSDVINSSTAKDI